MLNSLFIKNYVLIKELEIDFHSGFSVITGETGAGKSIILGAMNLIQGQRADSSAVLDSAQKCIVESSFTIDQYGLEPFFAKHQLDFEPQTILRREINANGKSRAFINDTPVTLPVLKSLSERLIDIHSQQQNLLLDQGDFQLSVVDGFAKAGKLLTQYRTVFKEYTRLTKALSETKNTAEKAKTDLDYFQFQFSQLEEANLKEDEQQMLEEEYKTQSHAEDITTALNLTDQLLSSSDDSVLSRLSEIKSALSGSGHYHALSADLEERIKSVIIELKDIASEAEIASGDIEFDQQRLDYINVRLNSLYELQQKHHVSSVNELIVLKNDLELKIDNIQNFDETIKQMEASIAVLLQQLSVLAASITKKRIAATPGIEKNAIALLTRLGMPNANFQCAVSENDVFTDKGKDRVTFQFSANKGGSLATLSKVASGGEKSRLMLVIKSLLSQQQQLPTILFDEIDTGISGGIAVQMGEIMRQMGSKMQVISITHLPQVAAKGMHHYKVLKTEGHKTSHTSIEELNDKMRLEELAKMLGSGKVSDATLKNAEELMMLGD